MINQLNYVYVIKLEVRERWVCYPKHCIYRTNGDLVYHCSSILSYCML